MGTIYQDVWAPYDEVPNALDQIRRELTSLPDDDAHAPVCKTLVAAQTALQNQRNDFARVQSTFIAYTHKTATMLSVFAALKKQHEAFAQRIVDKVDDTARREEDLFKTYAAEENCGVFRVGYQKVSVVVRSLGSMALDELDWIDNKSGDPAVEDALNMWSVMQSLEKMGVYDCFDKPGKVSSLHMTQGRELICAGQVERCRRLRASQARIFCTLGQTCTCMSDGYPGQKKIGVGRGTSPALSFLHLPSMLSFSSSVKGPQHPGWHGQYCPSTFVYAVSYKSWRRSSSGGCDGPQTERQLGDGVGGSRVKAHYR